MSEMMEQVPGDDSIVALRRKPPTRAEKQLETATKALAKEQEIKARHAERAARAAARGPLKKPFPHERIARQSAVSNAWVITVEDSLPTSEWADSERLKLFSRMARVGDEVVLRNDSFTHVARAYVVAAEPAVDSVTLRVWHEADLAPVEHGTEIMGNYAISYDGLQNGWTVKRTTDGVLMFKGLPSRREAIYRCTTDLLPRPVN